MLIANNNRYRTDTGIIIIVVVAAMLLAVTVIIATTTATAEASAGLGEAAGVQNTKEKVAFAFNGTADSECIIDVSGIFMAGYYAAHVDYHNVLPPHNYNETAFAPPPGQHFYYDIKTGQKIQMSDGDARTDYIQGYQLGWKDAQRGVFQVDC
jgi:hypothetical protein